MQNEGMEYEVGVPAPLVLLVLLVTIVVIARVDV